MHPLFVSLWHYLESHCAHKDKPQHQPEHHKAPDKAHSAKLATAEIESTQKKKIQMKKQELVVAQKCHCFCKQHAKLLHYSLL